MEEDICKLYTQQELISKIQRTHTIEHQKKPNSLIYKCIEDLNRHFPKEDTQMAKRHIKRHSASRIIREMQINTTMRYHLTPVRMDIIKNIANNKCCQGCGEKRTLMYCWWADKLVHPLWKTV